MLNNDLDLKRRIVDSLMGIRAAFDWDMYQAIVKSEIVRDPNSATTYLFLNPKYVGYWDKELKDTWGLTVMPPMAPIEYKTAEGTLP